MNSVHHNSYCAKHYDKDIEKYSNFSIFNAVYSAHNENIIQYPDVDMCIGEPLMWMTPYIYCKKFALKKKQPFMRTGFADPHGALLSGFHCYSNIVES